MRRLLVLVRAVPVVGMLAITGCTATPPQAASTGPSAAPCVPVASTAPTGAAPNGTRLPDLTLPCLTGGQAATGQAATGQAANGQAATGQVRLARVPRPAIVNLWASWCEPCRSEMPALQRYAAANAGRITVLGVDTQDRAAAARSVVDDLGIGYPILYDPDKRLLATLGYANLPVTVFISGTGEIHVYNAGQPLTEQRLTELATRYFGA